MINGFQPPVRAARALFDDMDGAFAIGSYPQCCGQVEGFSTPALFRSLKKTGEDFPTHSKII